MRFNNFFIVFMSFCCSLIFIIIVYFLHKLWTNSLTKNVGNLKIGLLNKKNNEGGIKKVKNMICVICFESIDKDKITLFCDHNFHKKCLETWFNYNNAQSCPLCKVSYKKFLDDNYV